MAYDFNADQGLAAASTRSTARKDWKNYLNRFSPNQLRPCPICRHIDVKPRAAKLQGPYSTPSPCCGAWKKLLILLKKEIGMWARLARRLKSAAEVQNRTIQWIINPHLFSFQKEQLKGHSKGTGADPKGLIAPRDIEARFSATPFLEGGKNNPHPKSRSRQRKNSREEKLKTSFFRHLEDWDRAG